MDQTTILGDWGSTRLRLWRVRGGRVRDRLRGPGIGALREPAADALRRLIDPWLEQDLPDAVVLCGVAGARGGLHEARYVDCPATAGEWAQGAARTAFRSVPLLIGAGVACRLGDGHEDVMRGEETQIFGALARHPELAQGRHTIVLPGTHDKWVTLDNGRITGLRTFITGELYALLGQSCLLAVNPGVGEDDADEERPGFAAGIAAGKSAPGLIGSLFHARVAQLRQDRNAAWARGYLSGLLIASEVAEMRARGELPESVVVIGDDRLALRYDTALTAFGTSTEHLDAETCTLAGLELIHAQR